MDGNLTDGERWSRELLDRLRDERFTPGAWGRFLAEAFARARVVRARRPALVRQSRRWGAAGLVAAAPFGWRAAAWWALWWAMVDWHLGMVERPGGGAEPNPGGGAEPNPGGGAEQRPAGGAPRERLGPADALTLARLWAVPLVRRHPEPWLVAAGAATDLLDGALARAAGPTRLGRDLDSTADTLFLDAALRGAVERHGLDARLLALERARLTLGAAVTFASYFGASTPAPPQRNRGLAALLAAAGALQAVSGRPLLAGQLLGAASGYRSLTRLRARGPAASA